MLIELSENNYKYIMRCFQELLPHYCSQIERTIYVDDYISKFNSSGKSIYSFDLTLDDKDIEKIKQLKVKLKKQKNEEEFELFDRYVDFFFFIEDYCKRINKKW